MSTGGGSPAVGDGATTPPTSPTMTSTGGTRGVIGVGVTVVGGTFGVSGVGVTVVGGTCGVNGEGVTVARGSGEAVGSAAIAGPTLVAGAAVPPGGAAAPPPARFAPKLVTLRMIRLPAAVYRPTFDAPLCAVTVIGANTLALSVPGASASRSLTRLTTAAASCWRRPSR